MAASVSPLGQGLLLRKDGGKGRGKTRQTLLTGTKLFHTAQGRGHQAEENNPHVTSWVWGAFLGTEMGAGNARRGAAGNVSQSQSH